jgi:hypothetical protein
MGALWEGCLQGALYIGSSGGGVSLGLLPGCSGWFSAFSSFSLFSSHGTASNQCATNVLTILHREVLGSNLFVRSHLQFNFGPEPKFGSVPEYGPRAEC